MPIPDAQINIAELIVLGTQAAAGSSVTPSINVFHFRRNAIVNPANKVNLVAAFVANTIVPLLAAANVRYTPNTVTCRWLDDALDPPLSVAVAGAGAIATDSEPSDDAVYLLYRTALRGQSYRGSKHFGGSSEVDTTGDILVGAGLARWQAVQAALLLPLVDASPNTWTPWVFTRKNSQSVVNPTTIKGADVTQVLLDKNIGTMRRRRSVTVR